MQKPLKRIDLSLRSAHKRDASYDEPKSKTLTKKTTSKSSVKAYTVLLESKYIEQIKAEVNYLRKYGKYEMTQRYIIQEALQDYFERKRKERVHQLKYEEKLKAEVQRRRKQGKQNIEQQDIIQEALQYFFDKQSEA